MPPAPKFGASLKVPGSFGNKKNLLKSLVRKVKPTKMSVKKASIKGILAKSAGKGMKASPGLVGGSPFPINAGLGTPNSAQMTPQSITGGGGANLGVTGAF